MEPTGGWQIVGQPNTDIVTCEVTDRMGHPGSPEAKTPSSQSSGCQVPSLVRELDLTCKIKSYCAATKDPICCN